MPKPVCPRCSEPDRSAEGARMRGRLSKKGPQEEFTGAKPLETDEAGMWWICQDCGLVWVPATGRRNRTVSVW